MDKTIKYIFISVTIISIIGGYITRSKKKYTLPAYDKNIIVDENREIKIIDSIDVSLQQDSSQQASSIILSESDH